MHAPHNFIFVVFLLALTAGAAQAAPQVAAPAIVPHAVVHHAVFRRYIGRRYIGRHHFLRAAVVKPAVIKPAVIKPAAASVKVTAAPKPVVTPKPSAPVSAPDYGGRDNAMPAVGNAAPDPAASAGRALEALVVVLAGVGGVVYVLKRFNLVKGNADGKSARIAGPVFGHPTSDKNSVVTVVSSQNLPGGAMLHVVRVGEKTLLLGATAQSIAAITEWDTLSAQAPTLSDEFEDYLTRADSNPTISGIAAANARLRSLLSQKQPEEPS